MMQKTLIWLNLYGREAVRHKLKNRQKMEIRHKLCVRMDGSQFL